jgi:hypothetical protein
VRSGRGRECRKCPALASADEHRARRTGRVEDGVEVGGASFQVGQFRSPVRQTGSPPIVKDQSTDRGKLVQEGRDNGMLP